MADLALCLWFDGQAAEAAAFYVEAFRAAGQEASLGETMRFGDGRVLSATFRLAGQGFVALNGGPHFRFTPALSVFVTVAGQAELDAIWDRLSAAPVAERCGWLTDRYGLSWQIVPAELGAMLRDADRERAGRVMGALMGMGRLDLAALRRAYDGESPAEPAPCASTTSPTG
jgi:predicted 3-demethylubiquinone-9 3-methyltransferase (glyoxalase superfamily)